VVVWRLQDPAPPPEASATAQRTTGQEHAKPPASSKASTNTPAKGEGAEKKKSSTAAKRRGKMLGRKGKTKGEGGKDTLDGESASRCFLVRGSPDWPPLGGNSSSDGRRRGGCDRGAFGVRSRGRCSARQSRRSTPPKHGSTIPTRKRTASGLAVWCGCRGRCPAHGSRQAVAVVVALLTTHGKLCKEFKSDSFSADGRCD